MSRTLDEVESLMSSRGVTGVSFTVSPGPWARALPGAVHLAPEVLALGASSLDAVLAHEVAHVQARDPQRKRVALFFTILVPALIAGAAVQTWRWEVASTALATALVAACALRWHSRRLEFKADATAVDLMVSWGYSSTSAAGALVGSLFHLSRPQGWSQHLSLHPSPLSRAARLALIALEESQESARQPTVSDSTVPLRALGEQPRTVRAVHPRDLSGEQGDLDSPDLGGVPSTDAYDVYDELSRIAPVEGLALLQIVQDESDALPPSRVPSGLEAEVSFISRSRDADLVRCLSEHFGVTSLPATVVFRDRHLVVVLEGPLTEARMTSLVPLSDSSRDPLPS